MSHIKQNLKRKSNSLRIFLIGSFFISLFALFDILTANAHAATTGGLTHKSNPVKILKSNLAELSGHNDLVLDWHTQSYEINFNLPTHEWYEALELFISASPEGGVSKRTPLTISFNGSDPIAINPRGSRFDAHIRLDTSRIRPLNNSLKITYQTPSDVDCLTPSHGKWNFDLSKSKLIARTRSKPRNLNISEIEPRLSHPMTTPKRVAIIARGANKQALEAILAQGIAQRTHTLPSFQFTKNLSDFTIIVGTNKKIRPLVSNTSLLSTTSPSLFIDTGVRPKLVLSAPNDAQLMELARAFASFHLPVQHRENISIFDLYSSPKLSSGPILTAQQYRLGDLGDVSIAPSWQPAPASVTFNVEDARTSSGILTLNLAADTQTQSSSHLSVRLNDTSLGYTKLDKKSKKVTFIIPAGALKPSGNNLVLSPEFASNGTETACAAQISTPSLLVKTQSKLRLKNTASTPMADLSRLASHGSLFNGTHGNTALVLTAHTVKDRASTLHFLGFAARQFGPQWVGADYYTARPPQAELNKNILIIGPNPQIDPELITNAPQALKLALNGKPITASSIERMRTAERHASNDAAQAFTMAARNLDIPARMKSGGIASIFPSPYADGKLIGIISATRPNKYSQALKSLSTDAYWNALQGSVTRWDNKTILMAQTSNPLPQNFFPASPKSSPLAGLKTGNFANVKSNVGQWFSGFKFRKPQLAVQSPISPNPTPAQLRGKENNVSATNFENTLTSSNKTNSVTLLSLQTGLVTKMSNLKTGIQGFGSNLFSINSADNLLANINRNRLIWTLIFAVMIFSLLAYASPKEA